MVATLFILFTVLQASLSQYDYTMSKSLISNFQTQAGHVQVANSATSALRS